MDHQLKLSALSITVLVVLCLNCTGKKENFQVFNQDQEPIDTLFIHLDDRTYFIDDIQPRQTKSIYIPKMYGPEIFVQVADSLPMKLSMTISYPEKPGVRIMMTKSRIVALGTYRYDE